MKNQGCAAIAVGVVASVLAVGGMADHAIAQPLGGDTEWVTIGAVGNAGYDRYDPNPLRPITGRGVVNYEYRMATTEITTGQWLEFINSVNGRNERGSFLFDPIHWGAEKDFGYTGPGSRFKLRTDLGEKAARMPVAGMLWNNAARYANWLHNGKQSDARTLGYGAYDASGFGIDPRPHVLRSPGAKFWIPSFDEWLKAVHFDPAKDNGDGTTGGWWLGPSGSDDQLLPGFPEDGGESSRVTLGISGDHDQIPPVGAYDARTPWGLIDASGGVAEWLEDLHFRQSDGASDGRWIDGSSALGYDSDWAYSYSYERGFNDALGLRIASIPAPGAGVLVMLMGLVVGPIRMRRRN